MFVVLEYVGTLSMQSPFMDRGGRSAFGMQSLVQMVYRRGLGTHLCGEPLLSERVDDLWLPILTDCDTSVCTAITCNNALSHSFAVE